MRFLVHWGLRRNELCDPNLCHDAPKEGGRCNHCPLDRLDAAQSSEPGQLLRRALDLKAALRLGCHISLDEISAEEFYAMLVIEEEADKYEEGKTAKA